MRAACWECHQNAQPRNLKYPRLKPVRMHACMHAPCPLPSNARWAAAAWHTHQSSRRPARPALGPARAAAAAVATTRALPLSCISWQRWFSSLRRVGRAAKQGRGGLQTSMGSRCMR
jgi:hypothetical protein